MHPSVRTSTRRVASLVLCFAMLRASAYASPVTSAAVGPTKGIEEMAHDAGVRAVIYGLPLVLMDLTMKQATNVARPSLAFAAPPNQFAHAREFPPATFKTVVRANVDTLYSSAFLDLSKEPVVLSVPDTGGRYYLMPMLDAWTNVLASPGKRTTGTHAGNFAITGPDWHGSLPPDMTEVKSPTALVWILGRTQTNGPDDYPAVRAIQNGYKLVPLSAFGKPYTAPEGSVDPSIDAKTPPSAILKGMSSTTFFDTLARLMKSNPPPASDAPVVAALAKIGIVPGKPFDPTALDPEVAKGLNDSVSSALQEIALSAKQMGSTVNGWHVPPATLGAYGSDYGTRALIALIAFGANLPEDAIYPTTFVDAAGNALNGAHTYLLHFDAGSEPPVNAFWSITMYDPQSFFVPNPIDRYAISSWMPLKRNPDGSIDIYIQHQSPSTERVSNWLPAPEAGFNMTLRMYWPKATSPSILDGTWKPPAVTQVPE